MTSPLPDGRRKSTAGPKATVTRGQWQQALGLFKENFRLKLETGAYYGQTTEGLITEMMIENGILVEDAEEQQAERDFAGDAEGFFEWHTAQYAEGSRKNQRYARLAAARLPIEHDAALAQKWKRPPWVK